MFQIVFLSGEISRFISELHQLFVFHFSNNLFRLILKNKGHLSHSFLKMNVFSFLVSYFLFYLFDSFQFEETVLSHSISVCLHFSFFV